jgi:cell wall-associated NlpC family hydrolase
MKPLSSREKIAMLVVGLVLSMNIGSAQANEHRGPTDFSWTASQTDGLMQQIEQIAGQEELERQQAAAQEELERQQSALARQIERARETELRLQIVAKALTYVGQVRYVLTGSTPSGWDCSGFTRYVFGSLGVELEHSAGAQKRLGRETGVPQPGDLVAFERGKGIEHIGIYVGDGVLVESTIETGTTRVVNIEKAYPENRWKLTYVNVLSNGQLIP